MKSRTSVGFPLSPLGQGDMEKKGDGREQSRRMMPLGDPGGLSGYNLPRSQDLRFQVLQRLDGTMGAVMDGGRMEELDPASLLPTPCLACLFLCLERTILLDKNL